MSMLRHRLSNKWWGGGHFVGTSFEIFPLGGLKNLLYNGAGAECNGANTFFSVKDSGVLRFFSK